MPSEVKITCQSGVPNDAPMCISRYRISPVRKYIKGANFSTCCLLSFGVLWHFSHSRRVPDDGSWRSPSLTVLLVR
ncbi:hypothetical protein J6590_100370, partial [Homalodisca vitripennis]